MLPARRLGHAEPVALSVGDDGFDAIELFFWFAFKLYSFGLQFFIGCATVGGMKDAGAQGSFFKQDAKSVACLFIISHSAAGQGWEEGDLQIGLFGRRYGQPAKAIFHRGVGIDLKTQRSDVKIVGFLLIEHKKGDMGDLCYHNIGFRS